MFTWYDIILQRAQKIMNLMHSITYSSKNLEGVREYVANEQQKCSYKNPKPAKGSNGPHKICLAYIIEIVFDVLSHEKMHKKERCSTMPQGHRAGLL